VKINILGILCTCAAVVDDDDDVVVVVVVAVKDDDEVVRLDVEWKTIVVSLVLPGNNISVVTCKLVCIHQPTRMTIQIRPILREAAFMSFFTLGKPMCLATYGTTIFWEPALEHLQTYTKNHIIIINANTKMSPWHVSDNSNMQSRNELSNDKINVTIMVLVLDT
jgi:hypothetical protein